MVGARDAVGPERRSPRPLVLRGSARRAASRRLGGRSAPGAASSSACRSTATASSSARARSSGARARAQLLSPLTTRLPPRSGARGARGARAARGSRARAARAPPSPPLLGRDAAAALESLSHQLIPISRAWSTEAISSRSLIVSSSMSSRLIWMSPAITMPLSSTRSRMSARLVVRSGRPGRRRRRGLRKSAALTLSPPSPAAQEAALACSRAAPPLLVELHDVAGRSRRSCSGSAELAAPRP